MARDSLSRKIEVLFQRCAWKEARALLEKEREKDPEDHWVLTQLGVTFYEKRDYEAALVLFRASLDIVDDCPLTLWNVAGTLAALGEPKDAMSIYLCLLKSDRSPEEDPCWESKKWTQALKADCVYRLGGCLQHLRKQQAAADCYRQYVNLRLSGIGGSYAIEDTIRQIRNLPAAAGSNGADTELHKAVQATLQASGLASRRRRRRLAPKFNVSGLLTGRHVARKR